jgi:hypothetical protein
MKKLFLIISALLFSILFYQKTLGVNALLFTLLTVTFISVVNFEKVNNKQVIIKAIMLVMTSILVFVNHNLLSFNAYVLSFFVFVGAVSQRNSSLIVKFFNGVFSVIAAAMMHYFEREELEIEKAKEKNISYVFWLKTIAVVTIVLAIFISLYRHANPVFNDLIVKIDLSFINMQWLLFTIMAYLFLQNITNPVTVEPITTSDLNLSNALERANVSVLDEKKLKQLSQLAGVLFVLLDALIVLVLVTDIIYLSKTETLSASDLSSQLHQGVNALIFSIVLAIALILYFFKGDLNFYKANSLIKKTTYVWIFLNVIMAIVTLYKNYTYVHLFGLTYKRIGVFVYLLLALFGLIFTFIKVKNIRNFWYLLRRNTQVVFASFLLFAFVNWDTIITKYNTKYVKNVDIDYLIALPNNAVLLADIKKELKISTRQKNKIIANKKAYLEALSKRSWQEYSLENFTQK